MEPSREFKGRELEGLYLQLSNGDRNAILWNARLRYAKHRAVNTLKKFKPTRRAHWVAHAHHPRQPRYERQLFLFLVAVIIGTAHPETIYFNILIGAALSFSFILYVLIRLMFSRGRS